MISRHKVYFFAFAFYVFFSGWIATNNSMFSASSITPNILSICNLNSCKLSSFPIYRLASNQHGCYTCSCVHSHAPCCTASGVLKDSATLSLLFGAAWNRRQLQWIKRYYYLASLRTQESIKGCCKQKREADFYVVRMLMCSLIFPADSDIDHVLPRQSSPHKTLCSFPLENKIGLHATESWFLSAPHCPALSGHGHARA